MVDRHRKALERLWTDHCAFYVRVSTKDPVTKVTDFTEEMAMQDIPCRVSFSALAATSGDGVAAVAQTVKLFLAPEIAIPAGCKIVVTRSNGAVLTYAQSGQPAIYSSHQEIMLTLWERWA